MRIRSDGFVRWVTATGTMNGGSVATIAAAVSGVTASCVTWVIPIRNPTASAPAATA